MIGQFDVTRLTLIFYYYNGQLVLGGNRLTQSIRGNIERVLSFHDFSTVCCSEWAGVVRVLERYVLTGRINFMLANQSYSSMQVNTKCI
jgi:hypothetical protein